MSTRVRIVLVDDHAAFRESLAQVLAAEDGFHIAAQFGTAEAAIEYLQSHTPDLVLVDYDLGLATGTEVLDAARRFAPTARVAFLTAGIPDAEVARIARRGALGIVPKESPLSTVIAALRALASGKSWFIERHIKLLMQPDAGPAPISERERQVVSGVVRGMSNKEIATALRISEAGVKAALQRLFEKTGVRTRAQLTRVVLERFPGAWK